MSATQELSLGIPNLSSIQVRTIPPDIVQVSFAGGGLDLVIDMDDRQAANLLVRLRRSLSAS